MEIYFPAPREARGEAKGRRGGQGLCPEGAVFLLRDPPFSLCSWVLLFATGFVLCGPGVGFSIDAVAFAALAAAALAALGACFGGLCVREAGKRVIVNHFWQ